jgi:hypothetical protein
MDHDVPSERGVGRRAGGRVIVPHLVLLLGAVREEDEGAGPAGETP